MGLPFLHGVIPGEREQGMGKFLAENTKSPARSASMTPPEPRLCFLRPMVTSGKHLLCRPSTHPGAAGFHSPFRSQILLTVCFSGVVALLFGSVLGLWLERWIARERQTLELPPTTPRIRRLRPILIASGLTALVVGLHQAEVVFRCLDTPEVQPPDFARQLRALYHGLLATFLLAATVIDLDCYLIPDIITVPGMLCGLLGAIFLPDLQIAHVWVDWSVAVPQLSGPFIPAWYSRYPLAHGLAWSTAGLLAGAGLTFLVKALSRRVLGQEAMGFGDVTLMAMIGSFLGWQAVVLTYALAPLTGLAVALLGKLTVNRPYLPYGPCLSAAALLVLVGWRWLWAETRLMFSDFVGLAVLGGIGLAALLLLLGLLRLYRTIPTGR
jgi:leader peptidase (prepilin peptidase)/N-methyltransferase